MKRLLLHIMRYFLPILFVSYLAGITFFTHMHVVGGVTIVHSHPFKKAAAHSHSVVELLLIDFLSHLITDGSVALLALSLFIPFLLCLLLRCAQRTNCNSPYHGVASLRAPPVIRFSVL